jgi:hypothetical protein
MLNKDLEGSLMGLTDMENMLYLQVTVYQLLSVSWGHEHSLRYICTHANLGDCSQDGISRPQWIIHTFQPQQSPQIQQKSWGCIVFRILFKILFWVDYSGVRIMTPAHTTRSLNPKIQFAINLSHTYNQELLFWVDYSGVRIMTPAHTTRSLNPKTQFAINLSHTYNQEHWFWISKWVTLLYNIGWHCIPCVQQMINLHKITLPCPLRRP